MNGQDGVDGRDGVDGDSPTAKVSKNGNITTITITDKNGTTTANVLDGANGEGTVGGTPSIMYENAVFIGDSIGQGYNNNDYSYIDVAKESGYFKTVTKLAVGGATLGPYNIPTIANGYSCIEQIEKNTSTITNADIIFIQFCANDVQSLMANKITIGTPNDTAGTTSVCAYLKKGIDRIYELNSDVEIVFLNLANNDYLISQVARAYVNYAILNGSSFNETSFIASIKAWNENVSKVLKMYGISIINILEDVGLNDTTKQSLCTNDFIHPNNVGHKRIFRAIINRIYTNHVYTDDSLVLYGIPADAYVVGQQIEELKNEIIELKKLVESGGGTLPEKNLSSISSTFTPGSAKFYITSTLDSLKPYLTVKANYSDGTIETVTGYTLSGSLATAGSNTVTVTYNSKTTTFKVTTTEVIEIPSNYYYFTGDDQMLGSSYSSSKGYAKRLIETLPLATNEYYASYGIQNAGFFGHSNASTTITAQIDMLISKVSADKNNILILNGALFDFAEILNGSASYALGSASNLTDTNTLIGRIYQTLTKAVNAFDKVLYIKSWTDDISTITDATQKYAMTEINTMLDKVIGLMMYNPYSHGLTTSNIVYDIYIKTAGYEAVMSSLTETVQAL